MSTYQYYEFRAADRRLTDAEMADLRRLTTRATITPTMLRNVYHWGDFRGDPLALMERYFDAFVYAANWGTTKLMLRLPPNLLDPWAGGPYEVEDAMEVAPSERGTILSFTSQDDEGGGWVDESDSESWMPALLPLRDDLAVGDLRALYLGWLQGAAMGALPDEEREPPIPPGLGQLSPPLRALVDFLGIDHDVLAEAAAGSGEAPAARTVGQLLARATARGEARLREEAEREVEAKARLEREQAAAREQYIRGLAGREDDLWQRADTLIETKRPSDYDRAVAVLLDLRDLSVRQRQQAAYSARVAALRQRYAKRPSLLARLDAARLGA